MTKTLITFFLRHCVCELHLHVIRASTPLHITMMREALSSPKTLAQPFCVAVFSIAPTAWVRYP